MLANHQIVCEQRSYSKAFTFHQHEFSQLLYPLQGSLDIETKWQKVFSKKRSTNLLLMK